MFPKSATHGGGECVYGGSFGGNGGRSGKRIPKGDSGSAARFFYCAKASRAERGDSTHPTVKPLSLMRYLCRLVTPPGGLILDPFCGSGTTGLAARHEGFRCILIDISEEYCEIAKRRVLSMAQEVLQLT